MSNQEKKTESISSQVHRRNSFLHGLNVNKRYTIFNWSFWLSIALSITIIIINLINHNAINPVIYVIKSHDFDIFSISIGAISIILAAIAIIVVIFNRKELSQIAKANSKTFESFIFPYRFSATLWGIIAISSLISHVISIKIGEVLSAILGYLFIWIVMYASMYMLYLIQEIIDNILFSSLIYNDDEK